MKPTLRNPELYEGMTLEYILNERRRTLAALQRMYESTTKANRKRNLTRSITEVEKEIKSVKQCMEDA